MKVSSTFFHKIVVFKKLTGMLNILERLSKKLDLLTIIDDFFKNLQRLSIDIDAK